MDGISLKQFIDRHNLTQVEAARQLHVTPETLNRIIHGNQAYTPAFVGRVYYYWHHRVFFDGVLDLMSSIAHSIDQEEAA